MIYTRFHDIKVGENFLSKDMKRAFIKISEQGYFFSHLNAERADQDYGDNRVSFNPYETVVRMISDSRNDNNIPMSVA